MTKIEKLRARLGVITARFEELKNVENISAHLEEINNLKEEFKTSSAEISALEALEEISNSASVSSRKVSPVEPAIPRIQVVDRFEKTGGFKNMGEMALAVKDYALNQKIDNRLQNSTHFSFNGEDGGFMIPDDFLSAIEKKMGGDESLVVKARQFQTSSNNLSLPIDEKQPWNGGIAAYWTGEGDRITESKLAIGKAKFEMHKLAVFAKVTDELLEDATSLESYLKETAPDAINYKINSAIINGDGNAKPIGILQSGFKISVAKESGQAADTIVYRNLIKMKSRLLGNGVWLAHPACREQLMALKDDNDNFIYMSGTQFANASVSPFETLLGLPIVYMSGSMPALGDEGDIILANMSYYWYVAKLGGAKSSMSTHLFFDRDITAFKYTIRLDGKCPFKSPVTTENGSYQMSGFVTIADRA